MDEHEHGDDGCLRCEVAWLGLVGPAAGQLVEEAQHYVDRQTAGLRRFRESVRVQVRREAG